MDQAYFAQVEQAQQQQEEAAIVISNVLLAAGIDPQWCRCTYLRYEMKRIVKEMDNVKHKYF